MYRSEWITRYKANNTATNPGIRISTVKTSIPPRLTVLSLSGFSVLGLSVLGQSLAAVKRQICVSHTKKNILLQYKTKYHQQMKLWLFCWQQNQNFLMRSQDIYCHVWGKETGYFWWEVRTFKVMFVATKLDNIDQKSGHLQSCFWQYNCDIFNEKSGRFHCVCGNKTGHFWQKQKVVAHF